MTEIDMTDLKAGIVALATNPDLRARLGAGALTRVRQHYDWAAVIPQYQALWSEQEKVRAAGLARSQRVLGHRLPIAPAPTLLFGAYPSETADPARDRYVACDLAGRPGLAQVLALRNYAALNRFFAGPEAIAAVLDAVARAAGPASVEAIAAATLLNPMYMDRVLMWLLKYDFIRRAG
jgi:hypothetical protein